MKKLLSVFGLASLCLLLVTFVSCSDKNDDEPVAPDQLPGAAMQFIQNYFPGTTISNIEYDKKDKEYEVYLSNAYEITFDQAGTWQEVDAPDGYAVPEGIVPEPILNFVALEYTGQGINEIDKTTYGYHVELINGMDLKFAPNGEFIGN